MKIYELGKTGLEVTELCFGVLPMGPLQKNISEDEAVELLREGLDAGINFIDTAEQYKTQTYVGKAIAGREREAIVLATKSASQTYEEMRASIDNSLSEFGTGYIDIYELHAPLAAAEVFQERAGALECLKDYKDQGKIRAVGISTHSVEVVKMAASRNDIDIIFPIINKLGLGIRSGTREEMEHAIAEASEQGKGLYAMKALAGGHLADEFSEAINYVKGLKGISAIAVGMVEKAELMYNVEFFKEGKVSPDKAIAPGKNRKRLIILDHCRACGKCTKVCPNQALKIKNGKAFVDSSKCILCGYCNPVCPQFALRLV